MMREKLKYAILLTMMFSVVSVITYADNPSVQTEQQTPAAGPAPEFYGNPTSTISSGVIIPEGSAYLYTSGTVPPLLNKNGKTVYGRYGDTKTQAIGTLKTIERQLIEQGLTMQNVVYLRAYLTPDAMLDGAFDYNGWFEAYAQFFNTEENPVKPARSTVGVASLVNSDWLIEIEAVAVYPNTK